MRRAVFLERQTDHENAIAFRVVMWFPVPADQRYLYINPRFTSALQGELKPKPDELQLLRSGAVREKVTVVTVDKYLESSSRPRTAQELLAEVRRQTEAQYLTELARQPVLQITASLYGTTYDDTVPGGWTMVVDTS